MTLEEQEQCIPGDLLYGYPPAIHAALTRPLRCQTGPWIWLDPPKPLPFWLRWQIDRALARRVRFFFSLSHFR